MTGKNPKPNPFATIRALQEAGEDEAMPVEETPQAEAQKSENAKTRKRANALSQSRVYRSSGLKVREDIHQAYKVLAAQTKKPLYLLMEEDLLSALKRRKVQLPGDE